jgi:hypothetical protein
LDLSYVVLAKRHCTYPQSPNSASLINRYKRECFFKKLCQDTAYGYFLH